MKLTKNGYGNPIHPGDDIFTEKGTRQVLGVNSGRIFVMDDTGIGILPARDTVVILDSQKNHML